MATLFNLSAEMRGIEDALIENGGELTPELEEALNETRESLIAKTDGYNALIQKFKASSEACGNEIKRIQAIKKTCDNAEKNLKSRILYVMGAFGIERLEGQFCKMYPRRSEKVETNEDQLLSGLQRNLDEFRQMLPDWVNVKLEINKTELKKAMKEGTIPTGAELVDNWTLTIK